MMKHIFILTAFICFAKSAFSQNADSTRIKLEYGTELPELQLLFGMEQVHYYKITSADTLLRNHYFVITTKEFRGKKLVKSDSLVKGAEVKYISYRVNDTALVFKIMSKPKDNENITFFYHLSAVGITRNYKKLKSNDYSLRDAVNSNGKFVSVPKNKTFPLLVYSLPYEDPKYPGYLQYCALTANGVPPEKWGEKYGVKHYIILELAIRNK